MSPRSNNGMIWSGCVYIIWMLGLSFLIASKPGSMFSTEPPFKRAAAIRNCWPEVPEMSGMASLPFHSGFQRSAHDVGGVFRSEVAALEQRDDLVRLRVHHLDVGLELLDRLEARIDVLHRASVQARGGHQELLARGPRDVRDGQLALPFRLPEVGPRRRRRL